MMKVSKKLNELSSEEKMIGLYDAEIEEAKIKRTQILSAERQGINQRNTEIAKNLLEQRVGINIIVKSTGLSKEEVESLK